MRRQTAHSVDDLDQFDPFEELNAVERRLEKNVGLNVWGRPLKTVDQVRLEQIGRVRNKESQMGRGHRRSLPSEAYVDIERRWCLGDPVADIARDIGCTESLVYSYAAKQKLKRGRRDPEAVQPSAAPIVVPPAVETPISDPRRKRRVQVASISSGSTLPEAHETIDLVLRIRVIVEVRQGRSDPG
jgi:hypothetical protein